MNKIVFNELDNDTSRHLAIIKGNAKVYNKMVAALNILGNFNGKASAEIFNYERRLDKTDIAITDCDGNIFIVTSRSFNKNDTNLIKTENHTYDLSLTKKENVTAENIDMCKTGLVFNHRHGRFITDTKTFFSLFLGDTCYQIIASLDKSINVKPLVEDLNTFIEKPTVKDYIYLFGRKLLPEEYDKLDEIITYKDAVRTGSVILNEEKGYSKTIKK